jgi:hypothetical protein
MDGGEYEIPALRQRTTSAAPEQIQKIPEPACQLTDIFVKLPTGRTIQIEADLSSTCSNLKLKITQSLVENKAQSYVPNEQMLSVAGM